LIVIGGENEEVVKDGREEKKLCEEETPKSNKKVEEDKDSSENPEKIGKTTNLTKVSNE